MKNWSEVHQFFEIYEENSEILTDDLIMKFLENMVSEFKSCTERNALLKEGEKKEYPKSFALIEYIGSERGEEASSIWSLFWKKNQEFFEKNPHFVACLEEGIIRKDPFYQGLSDITNETMFGLMKDLNETHTLVHFHANNAPPMQRIDGIDVPHVFELTWIRNDFVTQRVRNTESFPTKMDMKNLPNKPEYYFTGFPYTS
jgi:hypothetical protein